MIPWVRQTLQVLSAGLNVILQPGEKFISFRCYAKYSNNDNEPTKEELRKLYLKNVHFRYSFRMDGLQNLQLQLEWGLER